MEAGGFHEIIAVRGEHGVRPEGAARWSVDDDVKIVGLIRAYLQRAGFETAEGYAGAAAVDLGRRLAPQLIILDRMLPRLDGLSVLQRLRQDSRVPVLMLTARVDVADRVEGLEAGADDYLTKPFHPDELVARVRALLRRRGAAHLEADLVLERGQLRIDVPRREVSFAGQPVPALTAIEFRLLQTLAEYPGHVCTREVRLWSRSTASGRSTCWTAPSTPTWPRCGVSCARPGPGGHRHRARGGLQTGRGCAVRPARRRAVRTRLLLLNLGSWRPRSCSPASASSGWPGGWCAAET